MAESIAQSTDEQVPEPTEVQRYTRAADFEETDNEQDSQHLQKRAGEKIIWTPGFLLLFALTLVLGLSGVSVMTQAWSNELMRSPQWVLQSEIILVALLWIVLGIVTRSHWIRTGCVFGVIVTVFLTLNILTVVLGIPSDTVQSSINVATCLALLGAYVGLSVEGTMLSIWDTCLLFLSPVLGTVGVVLTYYLTPRASILTVYNSVATAALVACILCWWFRPSCWKKQPGPTFLFGLVPIILLWMGLVAGTFNSFFQLQILAPFTNPHTNANTCLFVQITLLWLFLGCLRTLKSELRN
jgi:hypothetical protein